MGFLSKNDHDGFWQVLLQPSGRSSRKRFIVAIIGAVVAACALIFTWVPLTYAIGIETNPIVEWVNLVILLSPIYFLLIACIRRTHDLGKKWYILLLAIIPFGAVGLLLYFLFAQSKEGDLQESAPAVSVAALENGTGEPSH